MTTRKGKGFDSMADKRAAEDAERNRKAWSSRGRGRARYSTRSPHDRPATFSCNATEPFLCAVHATPTGSGEAVSLVLRLRLPAAGLRTCVRACVRACVQTVVRGFKRQVLLLIMGCTNLECAALVFVAYRTCIG